jgi:hypothetical protein
MQEDHDMAVTIRKITLWRTEVENTPGTLARTLQPLAETGVSLQVFMGYRIPGDTSRAVLELYPVSGKRTIAAAQQAGLIPSPIPALLVSGDDRPGLGSATAEAIAGAGINMTFLVAQVVGRKYSAVYGFETEEDAKKATTLIKRAGASRAR